MSPNVIGYLAASVCTTLPFIYWATAPDWWRSRAGRALMMLLGSLAALFILFMSLRTIGDPTVKDTLRYIIYSSVLFAGVRLAILFMQLRLGADWAANRGEKADK